MMRAVATTRLERIGHRVRRIGMLYDEFAPAPALAPWVLSYWRFTVEPEDLPAFDHAIVPDGCVSVAVALVGAQVVAASIVGPSTQAHIVPVRREVRHAGIRLHPAAARPLLGIAPAAIANRILPIGAACPGHAAWVRETLEKAFAPDARAVLDRALATLVSRSAPLDALVATAAQALLDGHEPVPVRGLAEDAGLSERQFSRRFTAAVGLGPKAFAVVRRQRAAWLASVMRTGRSLADASLAAGFADQAHFSRDVRRSFAATPRDVRAYLDQITHSFPAATVVRRS
jgi:methylphosphotriester-DNA--protein-cysteine methyltransferase